MFRSPMTSSDAETDSKPIIIIIIIIIIKNASSCYCQQRWQGSRILRVYADLGPENFIRLQGRS